MMTAVMTPMSNQSREALISDERRIFGNPACERLIGVRCSEVQKCVAVFADEDFDHCAFDGCLLTDAVNGLGVGNDGRGLSLKRSREPAD